MSLASKIYYHIDQIFLIVKPLMNTQYPNITKEVTGYYNQFKLIQGIQDNIIIEKMKKYIPQFEDIIFGPNLLSIPEIFNIILGCINNSKKQSDIDKSMNYVNRYQILVNIHIPTEVMTTLTKHVRIIATLLK